jgi:predicted nucleotide-binding protein (sugar kinase/HSP70/actin superfamily)
METTTNVTKKSLPIIGATPTAKAPEPARPADEIEQELKFYEQSERERLGFKAERKQWADDMLDLKMTKKERGHVTLLISGLTAAQDFLCEGALKGLGYKVEYFGVSNNAGLQAGKEFGNRGQCNPTYYTVGGLVQHLIDLRDKNGMTSEEIVKNYVFVTAGACGPCRFGMYVTEYRKALRDAGFDGFRVMLFQQKGGLSQATGEDVGLEMNPAFFISIIKSVVCGDVLNALAYRIRPYELEVGATNRAMENAKKILYRALYEDTNIFWAMRKARREFESVKVDKLRAKAKVCIIGEFWAMTTEGDGNYALQKFLESEGAENDIQLTTAWLLYNIWETARDTRERMNLRGIDDGHYGLKGIADEDDFGVAKRLATMRLAELGLRVGFQGFAQPAGLFGYHLPDMDEVAAVAQDYYSNDLRGGEGHMEVGKLIVNVINCKAHMTLSVKPFGCMPSSGVSDGVQSLITNRYPGTIFCAVETSGDGAANFYSRVQMYMFKARMAAQDELKRAYETNGVTEAEVRAFLDANPKYASPLYHAPHQKGVAGSAANLVFAVAPLIKLSKTELAKQKVTAVAHTVRDIAEKTPDALRSVFAWATSQETRERLGHDYELAKDIIAGKAKDRFGPLVGKLAGKAYFENNPEVSHVTEPTVGYSGDIIAAEEEEE